jgi:hypothetical protein
VEPVAFGEGRKEGLGDHVVCHLLAQPPGPTPVDVTEVRVVCAAVNMSGSRQNRATNSASLTRPVSLSRSPTPAVAFPSPSYGCLPGVAVNFHLHVSRTPGSLSHP